jgi:hypothetical protein
VDTDFHGPRNLASFLPLSVLTGVPDPTGMYYKNGDKAPEAREASWVKWFGIGLLTSACGPLLQPPMLPPPPPPPSANPLLFSFPSSESS